MGERMMATLAPPAAEQNSPVREPERFSAALHRYWGYESFRPGQESIVKSIAAGRDACVVMPTGGGKSLCYQLPAVLDATTAVVISPLIALMQDQVAQLLQMGISAACLNAATPSEERNHILHHASTGKYQLLYLSPERIALGGTVDWLKRLPISFFAIDEAHCISEWGHEFRPEYRQLSRLRELFPDRPIAAFTCSAAIGYHGQMESAARRENQEKWIADEVRVMVGTMAFGLGINKAAVRAVIHLSLPKSVEQYYQEAGRAGRDALPADCFLFWQKKDTGLHAFFIGKIEDPSEKERAWQRYHEVERFVQSTECRQRHVCRHFGEAPKWEACGNCDVCAAVPDWLETETNQGKRSRGRPRVTQPVRLAPPRASSSIAKPSVDRELNEFLREWRRNTAKNQGISAFVVLHDSALEDLCLVEPSNLQELRRVSGFGDKKVQMYGKQIL